MIGWLKGIGKTKIGQRASVDQFMEHCVREGQMLEKWLMPLLARCCDGAETRPDLTTILARPLLTFQEGEFATGRRSLFTAHCYGIVAAKGLGALYKSPLPRWEMRGIDGMAARLISEEDVGPGHVGHAPNPRPERGVHVSYGPDALVGGVDSPQLMLLQRYRRLSAAEEKLSMFCLALGIVPVGGGVGIAVLEEIPGSRRGGTASFDLVGYRAPNAGEVDEWGENLEILDPHEVLADLSPDTRHEMREALERVDPFWPSFLEKHKLAWT